MCELFGLSANKPVNVLFTWKGFYRRGNIQPHGWGIAFYPDKSAIIFKEPLASIESGLASFIRDYKNIKGKIFISHIRYASSGSKKYMNTHPFSIKLNGKEWVFAHNGTVEKIKKEFPLRDFKPIGETDSEYAFCLILDRIKKIMEEKKIREIIEETAKEISQYGGFNFLLSNGECLFAFWSGHNSLYYLERKPPYKDFKVRLEDEDFSVTLSEMKDPDEKTVLISTKPLTDEKWIKFKPNKLYEFKEGEIKWR